MNDIKAQIAHGNLTELIEDIENSKNEIRAPTNSYFVPEMIDNDSEWWSYKKTAKYIIKWLEDTSQHVLKNQIPMGNDGDVLYLKKTKFEDYTSPHISSL